MRAFAPPCVSACVCAPAWASVVLCVCARGRLRVSVRKFLLAGRQAVSEVVQCSETLEYGCQNAPAPPGPLLTPSLATREVRAWSSRSLRIRSLLKSQIIHFLVVSMCFPRPSPLPSQTTENGQLLVKDVLKSRGPRWHPKTKMHDWSERCRMDFKTKLHFCVHNGHSIPCTERPQQGRRGMK